MENDVHSKSSMIKKIIKILLKILYQILIILCVLLIAIIAFQKVSDSNRSIGGYRMFRVITGSMMPEYDIGEVVISKEINPRNIKVGNDIVYRGTFGDYNGKIIMHKVTKIDVDENNNLNFHAQGLQNNSIEDPQIKANQIYGVVKFKSGLLSVLYKLATSIYSSFIIIIILVLNVFISFKFSGKKKVEQLCESTTYIYGDGLENIGENETAESLKIETFEAENFEIESFKTENIENELDKKENEDENEK